ncbi:MAG: helix-turn-helix transcriptional regulator [Acidobacteriota bacterium]|nr:helix-turn-helix transcriptional regulator [Acidobacteriota bacterium]MDE3043594.1 helix-turn-helix transcriptional regulator [Acidobacteriota bacterium]MDE3107475.1 helix-turn-helix transcriptional regulator [Acidobacteriota bacterium]MDE3222600.1 helix-turn-helix transcriptional regulator [Acidobacteriota bacterium]
MSPDVSLLAAAIGERVKQERQLRGWTLDQLAELAGASRRTVVNVEHGTANPSVAILLRLSDALGIGLASLVDTPDAQVVKVVRHGQGARLWSGESGGSGVLVASSEQPDIVELWDWTLRPKERYASNAHSSGTREMAQVLKGVVTITVSRDTFSLKVGDAISFPGDAPHVYANVGSNLARFSLVVFQPRDAGMSGGGRSA